MKTYIITRFSILDTKSDSWVITRENKNIDVLKNKLFSEERLSEKIWTLKNITYKSLISQINKNYQWLIYTSKELPMDYKSELYSLENNQIKIIEVEDQSDFFKKIRDYDYGDEYSTVRLDDDDGLNPLFVEKINQIYKKNKEYKIVSFPKGLKITNIDEKLYVEKEDFYYKKIALGLTMFNGNIYLLGNHTKINESFNILYDETPDMYLIFSSENCDTKRKFNKYNCEIFNINNFFNDGN
jgi:hypothetical protein